LIWQGDGKKEPAAERQFQHSTECNKKQIFTYIHISQYID